MDIKKITTGSYEQLYAHKLDNLDKMDQWLERFNMLKLTQEREHLNMSMLTKKWVNK